MVSAPKLLPPSQRPPSRVALRRAEDYDGRLADLVYETLAEFRLPLQGRTVLLKPNLVQADPLSVINTHPAVVAAAREAFLRLGAARVLVGEGPGHERDTPGILEAIRFRDHVGAPGKLFVDLNEDEVRPVRLQTRASRLKGLFLPVTVLAADFIVSMPKLTTHHWAGIERSILDINSTVRPDFAIVDGIVGMEGNGPIQGRPKRAGVLIFGDDPVAVDATAARLMGLVPERIPHLQQAGLLLGHLQPQKIQMLGEPLEPLRTPFEVLAPFRRLVDESFREVRQ